MPGFLLTSSVPSAAEARRAESQAGKGTGVMVVVGVLVVVLVLKYWVMVGMRACQAPGCGFTRL